MAHRRVPRPDHALDPSDQIFHRYGADATGRRSEAAVGGIVAIVAHHENLASADPEFSRIVEIAIAAKLEDRMLAPVRQRFDETRRGHDAAILAFQFSD